MKKDNKFSFQKQLANLLDKHGVSEFKNKSFDEVSNFADDNRKGFIDDIDIDVINLNSGSGDYSGNTYSQAVIDKFN